MQACFGPDPDRIPVVVVQLASRSAYGWPAARFLAAIAEHEIFERGRRRIERHLKEARLMPDAGHVLALSRDLLRRRGKLSWCRLGGLSCSGSAGQGEVSWPVPSSWRRRHGKPPC